MGCEYCEYDYDSMQDYIDHLYEIDDMVYWNLSFNIPIKETLKDIGKLDLLHLFLDYEEYEHEQ